MSVVIEGLQRVIDRFSRLEKGPSSETMNKMGNIGVAGIKSNFEGNPLGWAELKPETIERKGSSQILVDKKNMANAPFYRPGGDKELQFVNNDFKAGIHHFGTMDGRIPARPHMVLREEVIREMNEALREDLKK